MKKLNILIDGNIPFAKEIFSKAGNLTVKSGREIKISDLTETDALIVRSITKVDKNLLNSTPVKFVGTATTGFDHIDIDYLNEQKIGFSSALGSNANSVVEYVFAALYHYCHSAQKSLDRLSLGVVGTGNIGFLLASRAEKLGMKVFRNDPLLQESGVKQKFYPLEELLSCDIISIHTPLTTTGKYPSFHLFNDKILNKTGKDTLLINTSRGPVIDNSSLLLLLKEQRIKAAALDVWENEPHLNSELLEKVYLGTPHIAGYSYDGKVNGAVMIFNKLCGYFKIGTPLIKTGDIIPKLKDDLIEVNPWGSLETTVHETIKKIYNIENDSFNLKKNLDICDPEKRAGVFDILRKDYPIRREFHNYKLRIDRSHRSYNSLVNIFQILGMGIEETK